MTFQEKKRELDYAFKLYKEGKATLFDFSDIVAFIIERRLKREQRGEW